MFRLTKISRPLFNQHRVCLRAVARPVKVYRSFASSHDWQQGPSHPVLDKLAQHPQILKQLTEFTLFLQNKGIDLSQKPNYMQLMKVMSDPEVKEKTRELVKDMQAAGITLDMNSIREIQEQMAQAKEKEKDIVGKMKSFFKTEK